MYLVALLVFVIVPLHSLGLYQYLCGNKQGSNATGNKLASCSRLKFGCTLQISEWPPYQAVKHFPKCQCQGHIK